MWQAYKELMKVHWNFTIHYGWKILLVFVIIWAIIFFIGWIKNK